MEEGRRPESEVTTEAAHVSTPPWSSRRSADGSRQISTACQRLKREARVVMRGER